MKPQFYFTLLALGAFTAPLLRAAATSVDSDQGHLLGDADYSYVGGYMDGYTLGLRHVPIDRDAYMKGFQEVLADQPDHQSITVREKAQDDLEQITKRQMAQVAGENHALVANFISTNAQNPSVKSTASGLQYRVIQPGEGLCPTNENLATIEYAARSLKGESLLLWPIAQPVTLALDPEKDTVLQGIFEGIKLMRPGAEFEFYLKPELALRDEGMGPVGPGELLIVRVKLLSYRAR
jgi:FKBP-type peptidyl-prolyl cis-trans isomerase FklB